MLLQMLLICYQLQTVRLLIHILASSAFQLLVLILLFTPRYPPYCAHVHITSLCLSVSLLLPLMCVWERAEWWRVKKHNTTWHTRVHCSFSEDVMMVTPTQQGFFFFGFFCIGSKDLSVRAALYPSRHWQCFTYSHLHSLHFVLGSCCGSWV